MSVFLRLGSSTSTVKVFLSTRPFHGLPPSLLQSCDIVALSQTDCEDIAANPTDTSSRALREKR